MGISISKGGLPLVEYAAWQKEWEGFNLWTFSLGTYAKFGGQRGLTRSKCLRTRILKTALTTPRMIGISATRDSKDEELYCASLLALMKPWRKLDDLYVCDSFRHSLDVFLKDADDSVCVATANIRYMHSMRF